MSARAAAALAAALLAGCSAGTGVTPGGSDAETPSQSPGEPWETVVVTGDVVNLRAGPGTEYAVLDRAVEGDSLQVTGAMEDWLRVYVRPRSLFAWIYGPLTRTVGAGGG